MSDVSAILDPEAMLAHLAQLDFALARKLQAEAMAAVEPAETAELARAYQRIARSVRQSLALQARLKREREREAREPPPPPARPLDPPPRDKARIRARQDAVRQPVQRVIWSEYESEPDECAYYLGRFEERLEEAASDPAFGLVARDGAWAEEPLDDHVVRLCRGFELCEVTARNWRNLPDPPEEVFEDEEEPFQNSA